MNQLEKIDKEIQRLEREKKILSKTALSKERKERTRRLIQTGALCEKYFNIPETLSLESRESFFREASKIIKL